MEQQQIDDLKTNLKDYLNKYGINTDKMFNCINSNHRDNNASMKYFNDNKCYCFGCGETYDLIGVISEIEGLNSKEAFKKAIDYYDRNISINVKRQKENIATSTDKIELKNYSKAYKIWRNNYIHSLDAQLYMKERGISEDIIQKFNIGFNTFKFGNVVFKAIIIPITDNCFTARNINNNESFRYYKPKHTPTEILNIEALTNAEKVCVITEGEFDCLSFETIGVNSISLGGANNVNKFINLNKDIKKTYILALDDDEAGLIAQNNLIDYFNENKISYKIFNNSGQKDANMALQNNEELFKKEIKLLIRKLSTKQDEM